MKLSFSNIGWTSEQDNVVYEILQKYGFSGIEIAPSRIVGSNPYDHCDLAKAWKKDIFSQYGFEIPSMQSIWYGRQERIFGNLTERAALLAYTKKAIHYAEAMHIGNLVFGCPRNRSIQTDSDFQIGINFFRAIGDYAAEHHVVIAMEANPTIYNTNYINNTKDAFALAEAVGSEGFKVNLDLGTMINNEEKADIIKNNIPLIHHVHISEPGLKVIQQRPLHREIAEILKDGGYDKWISVEMEKQNDIKAIERVCHYVAQVFM